MAQLKELGAKVRLFEFTLYGEKFSVQMATTILDTIDKYQEEVKKIDTDREDQIAIALDGLKLSFDSIVGEGTFDKVYANQKDVFALVQTFENVTNAIEEEFNAIKLEETKKQAQTVIDAKKAK